MSRSRQEHLDSLRGIAALIVVFVHYFAAFYPYSILGPQAGYLQHSSWEDLLFFPPFGLIVSGHFAVCSFYILSGYVLSWSHLGEPSRTRKIISAIVKRPIRLGGLVWLSILAGSLLWYFGLFSNAVVAEVSTSKPWFSHYWAGEFQAGRLLVDLFTSSFRKGEIYNPPLWTIKIELYGSLMVYFFLLLFGRFKYRPLISVFLILFFKDSLYQGFWLGVLMADITKNFASRISLKSHPVSIFLMSGLFLYFSSYPSYVNHEFLQRTIYAPLPDDRGFGGGYAMLAAFFLFILAISDTGLKEHLVWPALKFLGSISYGLYVMHFLILGSFSSWLFLVLHQNFGYHLSFLITLFSGVLVTVLVAFIATRYVDNPAIKFANEVGDIIALRRSTASKEKRGTHDREN